MAQVVTVCEFCVKQQQDFFRLKLITGKTTTEKKKKCDFCKKPFRPEFLRQYVLSGKGAK